MEFFVLLFIICINSITLSWYFNKRIELIIPITVILMTLIVYITGLFDNLNIGVKIIEIISIVSVIFDVIYIIKNIKTNTIKEKISMIFTPGLFVYIAIYLLFIIVNNGRIFEDYDEFNHWAVIIKNMFMYNEYGTADNSIVTFNEYPPFTACFQYILLNLKGIYSEDLVIISQNILYLSLIIPICNKIDFEKKFKNLLLIVPMILLLPLVFYQDFFVNILVDGLLGILFAIGLFIIYKDKENSKYINIFLSLIITSLVLIKTTGLLFVVILIIFKFIEMFFYKEKISIKQKGFIIFIIILLPIILISSWYLKINIEKTRTEWDFKNAIEEKNNLQYKDEITNRYLNSFISLDLFTEKGLTCLNCIMLLIAYSIFVYLKCNNKKKYICTLVVILISMILFCIGLLWIYVSLFIEFEALNLASFVRYISTILITWLIFNSLVLCEEFKITNSSIYIFVVLTFTLVSSQKIYNKYIKNRQYINSSIVKRNYYTSIKDYEDFLEKDDKIYFFSNKIEIDNKYILTMNRYEMMGINIVNEEIDSNISKYDFVNMLVENNYDYIYLYKVDENFKNDYKEYFLNENVKEECLYKINVNQNDKIELQIVKY